MNSNIEKLKYQIHPLIRVSFFKWLRDKLFFFHFYDNPYCFMGYRKLHQVLTGAFLVLLRSCLSIPIEVEVNIFN